MSLEEQINTGLTQSSATIQVVSKPQRKDGSPGAGLSHPALANRRSAVESTRHIVCKHCQGKVLSQYFQTFSSYTQGLPALVKTTAGSVGFEPTPPERLEPKSSALDHSATLPRFFFFALPPSGNRGNTGRGDSSQKPSSAARKALCSAMAATRVFQEGCPWQRWDSNPRPPRDWSLNPAP